MAAEQGKIEVVIPSKYEQGAFALKIGTKWYNSKERRAGELEPGFVIRFTTFSEGKNVYIDRTKLISKEQPTPRAGGRQGGGGGGGRPRDPSKDKYWDEKAKRDLEKDAHQLNVVEPRIAYANCRSHAHELVDLYIRHGALALGAENAAKRKGIIDNAIAEELARLFADSMNLNVTQKVTTSAPAATEDPFDDLESDDLDADLDDDL